MFGFGEKKSQTVAHDSVPELYNHAGNLEKELEAIASREPLTLLTAGQISTYNSIVERAKSFFPNSVALKEDAQLIEEGDIAQAHPIYRVLHTAIVPTLHNALPPSHGSGALPGI
ncbi:MAG: hypothetical protein H7Y38_19780 [Armatimonadetes bacterium]|nr:hypothetical protein [Armatimonadota bacterium]